MLLTNKQTNPNATKNITSLAKPPKLDSMQGIWLAYVQDWNCLIEILALEEYTDQIQIQIQRST